ncbi:short chain dehydrogenase [Mesorhizobium sp. WSM3860]|uniref:short chain dehydrogenase n=1 Tax=Mesorhizobium sp. WSM3860 TaxID=2029403 RepID=UPI000BAF8C19|nr:short chain dehydrogenase [Mesorhizobium sp. WSM3860]PBC02332.1 short chain dehydrogenase [Mesorhizobium sp. WSM3860]
MKVVVVGSGGTIGAAVAAELDSRHEVVRVGRTRGDLRVDISKPDSIRNLYEKIGSFDALVCTAGEVHFAPLDQFTPEQFEIGLQSKLMGQVNLVTYGLEYIRDGGSFTLTSGLTNDDPVPQGSSAALVNGALEGFVRGAAIEMKRGLRINLVSPTVIEESLPIYAPYFRGTKAVPASEAALGYVKSIEGAQTGRIYRIGWSRESSN